MLRSLFYQIFLLVSGILLFATLGWPALLNKKIARLICRLWAWNCTLGAKYILRITHRISGQISTAPAIYASKHQSVWEAAFLQTVIKNPVFILKKELVKLPVLGLYIKMAGHIAIDRQRGTKMLKPMVEAVNEAIKNGNSVIIFPEGTRTLPGEKIRYKQGVAILYKNLPEIEIIPVSLNSGRLWPKGAFVKKPGTVDVIFHPPLPKKLPRKEFMNALSRAVESLD